MLSIKNAPPPLLAYHRFASAGDETTPTTISPSCRSAISVAQTGTDLIKFFVPSIGSIIHSRDDSSDLLPNSSPIMASDFLDSKS
ncbi:unannotated protein [freshwater metagenome]|uniref:Unannotated protein n=1 Tax=freshwater metagenome TaxID=449393 RepID=A0A6J6V1E3_9ZZZZ